jgi:hypothetical protein
LERRIHLDEVRRSLHHQLGVVHLDVERQHLADEVRLDVEHQHPEDVVHLDVDDPCPGWRKTDCCQDEPLGEEYPCPGLKKMGCCQGEECPAVELAQLEQPELQVQQVQRAPELRRLD